MAAQAGGALHDLPLVSTLAVGLSTAFLFGLIAQRLKLPPIVGYLFAGILIGPFTPGFVGDVGIAEQFSEVGIVLLMFGVGLHFSLKDLMEVRRIALPGAIGQIAAATFMGWAFAYYYWGWSHESGMMFGLALSVASTVVLLRSLEEHNLLQSTDGRIAVGWLIVEDLVMVLALVLIPALAETAGAAAVLNTGEAEIAEGALTAATPNANSPLAMLFFAIGKVGLFVIVMMVVGKRLLPWLLMLVARTGSRELFTLAVFASAIGTAFIAAKLFGVSFALGAFFAGMMIRESDLNHEVADRALPFQDAFAVLFFVSVGMLFDPAIIIESPIGVLATVGIILIGKSLAALSIVLVLGYPARTGFLVSAALAQIGEFSFILVALGGIYGLIPPDAKNLVIAGAIISIALNPFAFHAARALHTMAGRSGMLSKTFNADDADLFHLTRDEKRSLKDIVVLIGHGGVGKHISHNIHEAHIDLVIVDSNIDKIDALREQGYHAIAGDGTLAETLTSAAIEKAVAIVIAIPSPFDARRIFETARALNPNIKVLARAHNDEELAYFNEQSVDLALTGPREISRRMVDYLNTMRIAPTNGKAH